MTSMFSGPIDFTSDDMHFIGHILRKYALHSNATLLDIQYIHDICMKIELLLEFAENETEPGYRNKLIKDIEGMWDVNEDNELGQEG